jgi:hypothetical protein
MTRRAPVCCVHAQALVQNAVGRGAYNCSSTPRHRRSRYRGRSQYADSDDFVEVAEAPTGFMMPRHVFMAMMKNREPRRGAKGSCQRVGGIGSTPEKGNGQGFVESRRATMVTAGPTRRATLGRPISTLADRPTVLFSLRSAELF